MTQTKHLPHKKTMPMKPLLRLQVVDGYAFKKRKKDRKDDSTQFTKWSKKLMILKRLRTTCRRQHQNKRNTLNIIVSNYTTPNSEGIQNKL